MGGSQMRKFFARQFLSFCALLIITACSSNLIFEPHRVSKHSEVGTFHISATMVAPWEDFVRTLSPTFGLSEAQALAAAIPKTAVSEKQILDAFAATLKLAPPTSSSTSSLTDTLNSDGTATTSGTKTSTTGPGDLSKVTAPTAPTDASSAGLTQSGGTKLPEDAGKTISIDPFLKYTAATALYQEVKILNKYIQAAAQRHHTVPYIIRLQLSNVPFARHQPYDTHVTVSFFAREICLRMKDKKGIKSCDGKRDDGWREGWRDQPAYVVPLLVTDNLESLQSSRISNVIRQLSAAASILQGGFAASLGLAKKTEELNAVLANDLNSLMTVGRSSASSLNVRLGAMQEATAKYAMVARNYNVTLLVMVPEDPKKYPKTNPEHVSLSTDKVLYIGDIEQLRITGSVEYRDAETGELLGREGRGELPKIVQSIFEKVSGKKLKVGDRRARLLMTAIFVNDFDWFSGLISGEAPIFKSDKFEELDKTNLEIRAPANLWNALLERNASSGFFGERIDIPKRPPPKFPDDQTVLLLDDGKIRTQAHLGGGEGLSPKNIVAALTVPLSGGGTASLPATDVQVTADRRGLLLKFESLASWGVKPSGISKESRQIKDGKLDLKWRWPGGYIRSKSGSAKRMEYKNVHYRGPKLPARAMFRLAKSVSVLKVGKTQVATIRLHTQLLAGLDGRGPDRIEISVDNANIDSATKVGGGTIRVKQNSYSLDRDASVNVALSGLVIDNSVTISAKAFRDGREIGIKQPDLTVSIIE